MQQIGRNLKLRNCNYLKAANVNVMALLLSFCALWKVKMYKCLIDGKIRLMNECTDAFRGLFGLKNSKVITIF